jgi:hypothetical protein
MRASDFAVEIAEIESQGDHVQSGEFLDLIHRLHAALVEAENTNQMLYGQLDASRKMLKEKTHETK